MFLDDFTTAIQCDDMADLFDEMAELMAEWPHHPADEQAEDAMHPALDMSC